jgi:hypothetical protein
MAYRTRTRRRSTSSYSRRTPAGDPRIGRIEFSELRKNFLGYIDGSIRPKDRYIADMVTKWKGRNYDEKRFYGAYLEEMRTWIKQGYKPPRTGNPADYTPKVEKRRLIATDEGGELDFTLAWSGDPMPFREWEQRTNRPGLKLVLDYAMNCGTKAHVIGEYTAWLGGMISGLEIAGYDMEIAIRISVMGLMVGDPGGKITHTDIIVKHEGKASDFSQWSAMFSPGGFRMLGFAALGLHATEAGERCEDGLGYPYGTEFDAEFDAKSRTLHIHTPAHADAFPIDAMTEKIAAFGLINNPKA